jgi:hypothetical protein
MKESNLFIFETYSAHVRTSAVTCVLVCTLICAVHTTKRTALGYMAGDDVNV